MEYAVLSVIKFLLYVEYHIKFYKNEKTDHKKYHLISLKDNYSITLLKL